MLRACLNSLADQLIDATIAPVIIVVENDWTATCRPIIQDVSASCRFPMLYLHERVQGIARARNAALEKALALGVGWIAFIDDDEVAEIDWLAALMAKEYRDTPVLRGRRLYTYPQQPPFWANIDSKEPSASSEGKSCRSCSTANVRFSIELVQRGIRFDEKLGHMGGEDIKFFSQAYALGFSIKKTNLAITRETAHNERLTFFGQMYREYCSGVTSADGARLRHGIARGILSNVAAIAAGPLGIIEMVAAPLFIMAGTSAFKRRALSGGKKTAKACGRLSALVGLLPKPYKKVVGS